MEVALRRLDGVAEVSVSMSQQTFEVTYKPGASFRPEELREAVAQSGVKVTRFYISAEGKVEDERGRRFLVAGPDRFLLVDGNRLPLGTLLSITGSVDDSARTTRNPYYTLSVAIFRPVPSNSSR